MRCGKKNHKASECTVPATTRSPPTPSVVNSNQEPINKKRKFDKGHLKITELSTEEDSGNKMRSTSPAVRRTPRHTPLLTVKVLVAGEWVEAVVDSGASAPVIGKRLACKLGVWKRARKVRVKQGDGSGLEGRYVAITSSKVIDADSQLVKFGLDAEVLDIGDRDCILGLSWLVDNGF